MEGEKTRTEQQEQGKVKKQETGVIAKSNRQGQKGSRYN